MPIIGITHDEDSNALNKAVKYAGKISTGYAPNTPENKDKFPKSAGKFRMMKEKVTTNRIGDEVFKKQEWVENPVKQKELVASNNGNEMPARLDFTCLYKEVADMWTTHMGFYKSTGLVCKSNGRGTEATYLVKKGDNREWKTRECTLEGCPHYQKKECKPHGSLKLYPSIHSTPPNPYRYDTTSIRNINNIESALNDLSDLVDICHATRCAEAGQELPFRGLFGIGMHLILTTGTTAGNQVDIVELIADKDFRESVNKIIKRSNDKYNSTMAQIEDGTLSVDASPNSAGLLESAGAEMIAIEDGSQVDISSGEIIDDEIDGGVAEILESDEVSDGSTIYDGDKGEE